MQENIFIILNAVYPHSTLILIFLPNRQENLFNRECGLSTLGYSLGKVNYVIASLVDKGIIILQRFMKSKNNAGYRYVLTPHGIKEKYKITKAFIKRKMTE